MNTAKSLSAQITIPQPNVDFNSWPIGWLSCYIEKLQRKTITEKSKVILQHINLIKDNCSLLDNRFQELEELFKNSLNRLSIHMKKEELYLFPFIREITKAKELNRRINWSAFSKIELLIELLNNEHVAERMQLQLIGNVQEDCKSISSPSAHINIFFTRLAEFRHPFNIHIDLQNKFLFPKIIAAKYGLA